MSKVKVGIVEDEAIIALGIAEMLRALGYEPAGPAGSYTQALEMIAAEKPDLVLLDIQLSGYKDGVDLAAKLRREHGLPFIFLTANADEATVARAKQVSPQAYLTKPFKKTDLYTAIELCLHNSSKAAEKKSAAIDSAVIHDAVFIKQGHLHHKVALADILYLASDNNYLNVHTADQRFLVRSSLSDYLELLDAQFFVRVHKSYAVNLRHIQTINTEYVMVHGEEIPLSRSYRDPLLNMLRLG